MGKLKRLLRQSDFQLFLFLIFSILLNWPFIAVYDKNGTTGMFVYLVTIWAFIIGLLFFISRSLDSNSSGHDGSGKGETADV